MYKINIKGYDKYINKYIKGGFILEGLLKFGAIICMCVFTYIGKIIMGIGENEEMIYNYIGIVSIIIGVFSSSILGYLGCRMSEE